MNYKLKKSGFIIKKFKDYSIINDLRKIVKKHFSRSDKYYSKLNRAKFSSIALKCQKEIDKFNIMKKFDETEKNFLKKLVNNDRILYSSGGYLRAVRPVKKVKKKENLGWHRETFYSKRKFDSKITCVSFYHNLVVVQKGVNDKESNLVLKNSYENRRYLTRLIQKGDKDKVRYYVKYKIIYKIYTVFLFFINLIKKIILLRF